MLVALGSGPRSTNQPAALTTVPKPPVNRARSCTGAAGAFPVGRHSVAPTEKNAQATLRRGGMPT
jgi:hypothetical protein